MEIFTLARDLSYHNLKKGDEVIVFELNEISALFSNSSNKDELEERLKDFREDIYFSGFIQTNNRGYKKVLDFNQFVPIYSHQIEKIKEKEYPLDILEKLKVTFFYDSRDFLQIFWRSQFELFCNNHKLDGIIYDINKEQNQKLIENYRITIPNTVVFEENKNNKLIEIARSQKAVIHEELDIILEGIIEKIK